MFESRYSKVLTVILVIVIIAIIGLLGFLGYDFYQKYYITKEALRLIDEAVSSAHLTLIKYLEHGCAYILAYKETDQDFIYNGEVD